MSLIGKLYYYSNQYWIDISDPRVDSFFVLRGGLWRILSIIGFYLLLTTQILPEYMKNRKPLKLDKIMFLYNVSQMCMNIYGVYWSAKSLDYGSVLLDFKYPSRDDFSPMTLWLLTLGWVYTMARIFEFFDTIFFVLRKKSDQITPLHLYHHSIVPFVCWLSFKHNGMIPAIRLYLFLNTIVHFSTYAYLVLTALKPELKSQLWLKKIVIKIEISQFIILGTYYLILLVKQSDYPFVWLGFALGQVPLFLVLFCNFYTKKTKIKQTIN